MTWLDAGETWAAAAALVGGLGAGWFVPRLIARLPEPEPAQDEPVYPDAPALPPPRPKELYVDLAARPRLALGCALATGVVAAILAAAVGPTGALIVLMPLVPIGVALAVIDWRTTLLPTRIIGPTYGVLVPAILLAGVVDSDRGAVLRAVIGWAVMGGFFLLYWFVVPSAIGYGDVRLAGVLGLALGYVGNAALGVGLAGSFFLGGFGGLLLVALKLVDRKRFPFGPFMLAAAVIGVTSGGWIATSLGY